MPADGGREQRSSQNAAREYRPRAINVPTGKLRALRKQDLGAVGTLGVQAPERAGGACLAKRRKPSSGVGWYADINTEGARGAAFWRGERV